MEKKTKHRIVIACFSAVLSALGTFVGAGLACWAFHVLEYGMRGPQKLGWIAVFVLSGMIALFAAFPALLMLITLSIVWCTPLGRQSLLSIVLGFVLGGAVVAICTVLGDLTLSSYAIAGGMCLGIVAAVEALMWKKLQNRDVEATS